jgi:uncharacterized protein
MLIVQCSAARALSFSVEHCTFSVEHSALSIATLISWSKAMPVDAELLEILACPNCKTKVDLVKNGTALKCDKCKRVYPIKDDIPVMLIDEATIEP